MVHCSHAVCTGVCHQLLTLKLLHLQEEARSEAVVNRTLVSAQLLDWAAGSNYPIAQIRSSLGQAGVQAFATANYCCISLPYYKACHDVGAATVYNSVHVLRSGLAISHTCEAGYLQGSRVCTLHSVLTFRSCHCVECIFLVMLTSLQMDCLFQHWS